MQILEGTQTKCKHFLSFHGTHVKRAGLAHFAGGGIHTVAPTSTQIQSRLDNIESQRHFYAGDGAKRGAQSRVGERELPRRCNRQN